MESIEIKLVVWVGGLELGARPGFFGRIVKFLVQTGKLQMVWC